MTHYFALFPILSIPILFSPARSRGRRGIVFAIGISLISIFIGYAYGMVLGGLVNVLSFLAVGIFQFPLRRELQNATRTSLDHQLFLQSQLAEHKNRSDTWVKNHTRLADEMEQISKRYSFAKHLVSQLEERPLLEDLSSLFSAEKTVLSLAFEPLNRFAIANNSLFTSGWVRQEEWEKILMLAAHPEHQIQEPRITPLTKIPGLDCKNLWKGKGQTVHLWSVPIKWDGKVQAFLNLLIDQTPRKELTEKISVCAQLLGLGLRKALLHRLVVERGRRDGLTNLYLRRVFVERLAEEINFSKRYGTSFSLLILDLDLFKSVNDRYGHPSGDAVLKSVSETLSSTLHHGVTIARYGGEEFAVLIGLSPAEEIMQTAENLRAAIEKSEILLPNKIPLHITISIGVSHYLPDAPRSEDLIRRADTALYQAKQAGRNCVREWKG